MHIELSSMAWSVTRAVCLERACMLGEWRVFACCMVLLADDCKEVCWEGELLCCRLLGERLCEIRRGGLNKFALTLML